MATKKFCDFCDTKMDAGDQSYKLCGGQTSERNYYHDSHRMTLPGNIYVDIDVDAHDVCKKCYTQILIVIENLKNK